jgi:hypothetical protein
MATITVDMKDTQLVGENIAVAKVDNKLVIVVDLTSEVGMSSTGKMMGIASTGGFAFFPGNLKGNIYIGRKV